MSAIPRNQLLVSSIEVKHHGGHAEVRVVSRGALAGTLTTSIADAGRIQGALLRLSREESFDDHEVDCCEACEQWFPLDEMTSLEDGGWGCKPCVAAFVADEAAEAEQPS